MIDTEALRKKAIDLAIQGKLTEQLPSDGNAEELYDQILNQKAQLIKEGKIKKEKAMLGIKADEIPFEIPENWKWVRLRDICKKIVDGDHNPPAGIKEKTEYLMLSAQNINNDKLVNIDNARYLTEEVFNEENKRTQLEVGDVLLTIVATLGRSCVYRETYNICFQRSVCVISTLINPDYLKRVLDSGFVQKLMVDGATGAAQPGFYLNKVEKICIPVPPMEMQTRIVDRIGEVLEQIDIIDELQAKYSNDLAVLKSKIIDAGIQGKLTERLPEDGNAETLYAQIQEEKDKLVKEGKIKKEKPLSEITDDEIPFEIPNNWKWVRLGEVSILDGTGIIRSGSEQFEQSDYYYLKMNNIGNFTGKCDFSDLVMVKATEDEYIKYRLKEGDFLFNTRNSAELVGKCAVVHNMPYDNILFNNNILRINFLCGIDSDFIKYYFISSFGLSALRMFVSSTTNVAAIYQRQIIGFSIPIPPIEEQKRIIRKIDELLKVVEE